MQNNIIITKYIWTLHIIHFFYLHTIHIFLLSQLTVLMCLKVLMEWQQFDLGLHCLLSLPCPSIKLNVFSQYHIFCEKT